MQTDKERSLLFTQVSFEWGIEDFLEAPEDSLYSANFCLSDAEWYLGISTIQESSEWISLNIFRDTEPEILPLTEIHHVDFTLGLRKSDGSVYKSYNGDHKFSPDSECEGVSEFLEKAKLLELKDDLVPEDKLNVFCVMSLRNSDIENVECQIASPSKQQAASLPCSTETLVQNFVDLCLNGTHADVILDVNGQEFRVHRSILAARSPIFASVFEESTTEKVKDSLDISITDCDPNSFEDFLLFVYTGKAREIKPDNVFGLYKTANKYGLDELKKECVQFMIRDLSVDSFCDAVLIANDHNESELLQTATRFFIDKLSLILITEKWKAFIQKNALLANELFVKMTSKE